LDRQLLQEQGQFRGGLRRIEQALELIKSCDPIRYRRLLQDLERVWITLVAGGLAHFDVTLLACEVDERFVLAETTSVEQISATIVHEATHARLSRRGIEYEEAIRARLETICLRREIAFSNRLPDGDAIRDLAERTLSLCSDPAYWTDAAFTERYTVETQEALRHLGTPDALIRFFAVAYACRMATRKFPRSFARKARVLRWYHLR
jgi:hypothetical protein